MGGGCSQLYLRAHRKTLEEARGFSGRENIWLPVASLLFMLTEVSKVLFSQGILLDYTL